MTREELEKSDTIVTTPLALVTDPLEEEEVEVEEDPQELKVLQLTNLKNKKPHKLNKKLD